MIEHLWIIEGMECVADAKRNITSVLRVWWRVQTTDGELGWNEQACCAASSGITEVNADVVSNFADLTEQEVIDALKEILGPQVKDIEQANILKLEELKKGPIIQPQLPWITRQLAETKEIAGGDAEETKPQKLFEF